MIAPLDSSGRWWFVHGIDVDLNAVEGSSSLLARAAALANRDAVTDEDRDLAAYLEWAAGNEDSGDGALIAVEFAARRAWQLAARLNTHLDMIEGRRAA